MRFSVAAAASALVATALAGANNSTVYVPSVVATYTTYCPEATKVTQNGNTYTVTEPGTLVITDCPCTVSSAISSAPVSPSGVFVTPASSAAVSSAVSVPPSYNNTTSAPVTVAPVSTPPGSVIAASSSTTGGPAAITGAAGKVGAGLVAVMGFAALAL